MSEDKIIKIMDLQSEKMLGIMRGQQKIKSHTKKESYAESLSSKDRIDIIIDKLEDLQKEALQYGIEDISDVLGTAVKSCQIVNYWMLRASLIERIHKP